MRDETLASARAWLIRAGVIRPDGSVVAWLAAEAPERQFVSAEIAGYAASYLSRIGAAESALRVARWLVSAAQDEAGGFRCRWYARGAGAADTQDTGPLRWSFDAGIILKGLADVHLRLGAEELRGPLARAAEFLLTTRGGDGLFPARWDAGCRSAADDPQRWSTQSGAYHAKIERGLLAAARQLGRPALLQGLEDRVALYIRRFQGEDGRFVSYPQTGGVHAHPHLYACESLWALGAALGVDAWRQAARRGIAWLADRAVDGRVPRTVFDDRPNFHGRCDVAAQYLRCLVCIDAPARLVEPARRRLCEYFDPGSGGFVFGWDADGTANRHPDTWGTMAAIQALSWARGDESPDPSTLI